MSELEILIQLLPKAELHLHIEGTLEPELMFKLSERNRVKLRYSTVEEIRRAYEFDNLQSFLNIYYQGAEVLQTELDFYELAKDYIKKCYKNNIIHTEIFFDPQTHTKRGVSFDTCINGIWNAFEEASKSHGLTFKLILCFLRHLDEKSAFETLDEAILHKDKIEAIGLDSAEIGNPPSKFKNVFEKAILYGFKTVAHAGEEGPPEYIKEAIDLLKVSRIDHGVRIDENYELVQKVIEKQIPLTVCPLSNVKLRIFSQMKDHNLKKLLDKGLLVTINSDDPAYFGGYLNQNYLDLANAIHLSNEEIVQLCKNSFKASFLTESEKLEKISIIDEMQLIPLKKQKTS